MAGLRRLGGGRISTAWDNFKLAHPKVAKTVIVGACVLIALPFLIWAGVAQNDSNTKGGKVAQQQEQLDQAQTDLDQAQSDLTQAQEDLSKAEQDYTDLQGQKTEAEKQRDDYKEKLDALENQQEFAPTESQVAQLKTMIQGRGGKIQGFDSFTYEGDNVVLYFTSKDPASKADTLVAVTIKAPGKAFTTEDIMNQAQAQFESRDVKEQPTIAVFRNIEDYQLTASSAGLVNGLVSAVESKKAADMTQEQQQKVLDEVTSENESGVIVVASPEEIAAYSQTMFSISQSAADSKGNSTVAVQAVSRGLDGKWHIEKVTSKQVGKYQSVDDAVVAAVTTYAAQHGVTPQQVQSEDAEA